MDSEESVLQEALLLLDRGQPKSAEPLLRALIGAAKTPDSALLLRSLVALGECLAVTGRPGEARRLLLRALAFTVTVTDEVVRFERERAQEMLEELDE
ncbi:tetratricopeptide repeat protein [Leucobacter celer]|uniref:tetratricopeptide repeat protein n=1 Tax=Leucobacter celer TaxID=668625 RepID=UPI0006A7E34F|nr:tetratricopeptide repeat protein [Leucobacter celer]